MAGEWILAWKQRRAAEEAVAALTPGVFVEVGTTAPASHERASYLLEVDEVLSRSAGSAFVVGIYSGASDEGLHAALTRMATHEIHLCGSHQLKCREKGHPHQGATHVDEYRVLSERVASSFPWSSTRRPRRGGSDERERRSSPLPLRDAEKQGEDAGEDGVMRRVNRLRERFGDKATDAEARLPRAQGSRDDHRGDGDRGSGPRGRSLDEVESRKRALRAQLAELESPPGKRSSQERERDGRRGSDHRGGEKRSRRDGVADVLASRAQEADQKARKVRHRRKHKKSRHKGSRRSSSSSSYSSDDSDADFRKARGQGSRTPQITARLSPGRHLEGFLSTIREYLSVMDGDPEGAKKLPPVAMRYLTTVLLPAMGNQIGFRDERELRTLAESIDSLVRGKAATSADILVQRFKSIELRLQSGTSQVAKHLELIPESRASATAQEELEQLVRMQRDEAKVTNAYAGAEGTRRRE